MTRKEWLYNFGVNLRRLMEEKGVSQSELAQVLDMSEATVSRYLNEKQTPTMDVVVNIAYELRVTVDELIDFGEPVD